MNFEVLPEIESEEFKLRYLSEAESYKALAYFDKNKDRLSATMPAFSPSFFTEGYWVKRIELYKKEFFDEQSIRFFMLSPCEQKVIGGCNFTDFIRGVYQGCFLGYGIDGDYEGRGLMTKALSLAIDHVFRTSNIHKINANYMPHNLGSGRVLEKLGFEKIGLAKKELYLSGQWQDHIETRLINDHWENSFI
jgi:ribosomal-protein-alanine N-acetyltransferase